MVTLGGGMPRTNVVVLTATNFGPIECTLKSAILREPGVAERQWRYGVLNPLHEFPTRLDHSLGPFSGGLPKKIGVGEEFSLYFPYNVEIEFLGAAVDRIGVLDTFGRQHWCRRRDMRDAHERFVKDFGEVAKKEDAATE